MQWILENSEAVLTILSCLAVGLIALLRNAGWIQKKRADELTGAIENTKDSVEHALNGVDLAKLDAKTIAKMCERAVKGSVKQRMKNALKNVGAAIADGAAEADPDPDKKPQPPIKKLLGLFRSRIFG